MSKEPKHILVIRLSAMGDVAMTVPVLCAFRQHYPDTKITILTRQFFAPFFRNLEGVTVFHADVKGKHKGVFGLYRLSKELKALNIDAVADLHNVLRTKILKAFLSGKAFGQINKGRAEKKALVAGDIFKPLKTTHQRYVDVFEALGFPFDLSSLKFPKKREFSETLKAKVGKSSRKQIGIAPFAAHESKMYPLKMMEALIKQLSKTHRVLLFGGGKKEIERLEELQNINENVISLAGKLSLDEELDVISNLDVMLSMDSGNAHIAAMLGIKVITIWGVTHPFAGFAPFNQPNDYALLADRKKFPKIPTSIYGNKYPDGYKTAAGSISPEIIVTKIASVI